MSDDSDTWSADPLVRARAWNRCFPGNVNVELLVDDLVTANRALIAERDALLRAKEEAEDRRDALEAERMAMRNATDLAMKVLDERDALRTALREWLRLYDAPKDGMPGRAYTEHLREVRTCVETTRALLLSA